MQSRMSTVSGKWNGTKNILLPSKKKLNNCLFSASTLNTAVATHLIFSLHQSFYFTAIQISIIKPWNHRLKVPIKIGVFSKCCMRILNFLLFLSVLSIPLSPHCKATHSFFCYCLPKYSVIMRFCVTCICISCICVVVYSLMKILCLSYLICPCVFLIIRTFGRLWHFISTSPVMFVSIYLVFFILFKKNFFGGGVSHHLSVCVCV